MSSATTATDFPPSETPASRVDLVINQRISEAAAALWRAELLRAILQLFTATVVGLVVWAVVDQWLYSPGSAVRVLALTVSICAVVAYVTFRIVPLCRSQIRPEYAARSLERDLPELRQGLLSYVTLRSGTEAGGLQSGMVRSLGAQTAGRLKSFDQLPSEATGTLTWWFAAIGSLVFLLGYAALSPKDTLQSAKRLVAPLASIAAPKRVTIDDVAPGDVEALAGQVVDVSAQIRGLHRDETPLVIWQAVSQPGSGKPQQSELQFDSSTRRFSGSISLDAASTGNIRYELTAGDAVAGPYQMHVKDVPVIVGLAVHHQPPRYTGEKPYTRSGGAITALSGSILTLSATTNRPVSRAKIEFNPRQLGQSIQATAGAREMKINAAGTGVELSFPVRSVLGRAAAVELENYRIQIWDDAGQSSPDPIVYPIRVIEDLAPDVTIVVPQQTPKEVPIDAQQIIEVHAIDPDYGLNTIELELRRGIDLLANPVLFRDEHGARGNRVAEYRFRPTEHGLRVGDVVSITAVASDNRIFDDDPSIEPNYSSTDPIQLKITMGEPPSGKPDRNDGLSKKDDRPSSDTADKGQQGEQGGGSGAGGEAGAQSTAKGDSGGQGQSGNSSSKGEQQQGQDDQSGGGSAGENSTSNEPSNSPDAQGNSDSKSQNSGEQGAASQGAASQSPSSGDPSKPPADNPNDKDAGGDSLGGKSPAGSPANGTPQNGRTPQDGSDTGSESMPPQGESSAGEPATGGKSTASGSSASKSSGGKPSSDESFGDPSAGDDSSSDNSSGEGSPSQAAGAENRPPGHDGEAFERIREHLNQQKAAEQKDQQSGSGGKQNQQPSSDSGANGSSKSEPGDKPDAGTPKANDSKSGNPESGNSASSDNAATDPAGSKSSGATDPKSNDAASPKSSPAGAEAGSGTPDVKSMGESEPSGNPESAGNPNSSANGTESGKKGSGKDSSSGESSSGESSSGGKESGGAPSDNASKPDPKSNPSSSKSSNKSSDAGGKQSAGESASGQQSTQPSTESRSDDPSSSNSMGEGGTGASTGADSGSASGDVTTPVDAADMEYTKKATDMVLDYLKETRDAPDKELLEKLKWTENDLRQFNERWQKLRESAGSSPLGENREIQEALQSLGMRPSGSATSNRRLEQDSLRGLRDSGTRQPPPAALRDAFDAFRRAASRQNP